MLVVPTFQKGDLAKQQPVYQGRVGDGGQGDGAEAGAKEGLGLRVGRGLAIDCDGQGCEDEERDLGRRELAVASASFANITNTLCSLRGRGPASLWPKKHNFTILRLSASFTNFTVPSPPKPFRCCWMLASEPPSSPLPRNSLEVTGLSLSTQIHLTFIFLSKVVFDRETGSG